MTIVGELLDIMPAPALEKAACLGRWSEHDPVDGFNADKEAIEQRALNRCLHQCSCLDACTSWLESLPPVQRPVGVVAGRKVA
jgi:hypothetical protein